jgi:PAS domain S-box-containing protein
MRDLKSSAIIVAAYLIAGIASLSMGIPPGFLAPVWLPAAVGLAAVLTIGYRALPAIFFSMIALTLPFGLFVLDAGPWRTIAGSTGVAAAAVVQALVAKRLVPTDPDGGLSLEKGSQLARLIGYGAIVASLCGAAFGSVWVTLAGAAPNNLDLLTTFARNWVGNAVGAAALTPVILLLIDKTRVSLPRKRSIALIFTILTLIGVTTFVLTRMNALEERRETFNSQVVEDHIALQERINGARRRLESLQGFFAASENVTEEEFATFVDIAFGQFEGASSVHWLVNSTSDRRPSHAIIAPLEALRFDTGHTIPIGPDQRIVTDYTFEGLDQLVAQSLSTGLLSSSGLNGDEGAAWIALAIPAFAGRQVPASEAERPSQLTGIAIGTFRIDAILSGAFSHEREVYTHQVRGIDPQGRTVWAFGSVPDASRLSTQLDLLVGGQVWRIDYVATDRFLYAQQDWVSWAVIVIGLCFVTVLNALALLATARTDLVQRLVDEKTAETLSLSNNLSLVLEHAADAILSFDGEGRGVLINPAAAKLLGYRAEELTGKVIHDIIHPVDRHGHPHSRAECAMMLGENAKAQHSGTERFRRKDGSDFFAEYSTEAIRDGDGKRIGSVTVLRDITDRIAAEADRERFIERLTRANEELERFAFVASHDLQEPLRLISNFTGLLASRHGETLEESGRTYIRHTLDATARMQGLITDLLTYGRLNSDTDMMNSDVDLGSLVPETLDTLGPSVQAVRDRIEIGDMPVVRANPARMRQLLQNLIGNAVKFQPVDQDAEVAIRARDLGDRWEIEVADNGIGIKPEYREQIFMPFKRLHSPDSYPGSGMGLAICRKIVESHGGVPTVSPNGETGSIFRFTLPKSDLPESRTDPQDEALISPDKADP